MLLRHFIFNRQSTVSGYQPLVALLAYAIVVEPYPVRVLAAGCPILTIFRRSRMGLFHPCVVAGKALRVSQSVR